MNSEKKLKREAEKSRTEEEKIQKFDKKEKLR